MIYDSLVISPTTAQRKGSHTEWNPRKEQEGFICTSNDEQTVRVCDGAIGREHERLQEAFGKKSSTRAVPGRGTLVQAPSTADVAQVQSATRKAIDQAQHNESISCSTQV